MAASNLALLLILFGTCGVLSQNRLDPKGWQGQLAALAPNLKVNQINMPGTHESMSFSGGQWAVCNAYTVTEQLNAGYRWFDIRLKLKGPKLGGVSAPIPLGEKLYVYHGILYQNAVWNDLHEELKAFLATNPTECVVLKVKDEGIMSDKREFADFFAAKISKYTANVKGGDNIYYFGNTGGGAPTIPECGGKVIVLADQKWGNKLPWQSLGPVIYNDINFGKGNDAMLLTTPTTANGDHMSSSRIGKWKDAMMKTIAAGNDATGYKWYRNGINTNSKSASVSAGQGTPSEWAKILNGWVYTHLKTESFSTPTACTPKFYGAVNIDIPRRGDNDMMYRQIATTVILSNCVLYNWVDAGFRNFGNIAVIIQNRVGGLGISANVDYLNELNDYQKEKEDEMNTLLLRLEDNNNRHRYRDRQYHNYNPN